MSREFGEISSGITAGIELSEASRSKFLRKQKRALIRSSRGDLETVIMTTDMRPLNGKKNLGNWLNQCEQ